ncbi:hypothetical protein C8J56DRAFT_1133363 [Mycena floridula]|nr:hypothetical protein C8J56DRAFT_1133363 [Mycena floridula]
MRTPESNVPEVIPTINPNGTVTCPACHTDVNIGHVGISNWSKRHLGSEICARNLVQWKAEQQKAGQQNMLQGWFAKGAAKKAAQVPPTVMPPALIQSLAPTVVSSAVEPVLALSSGDPMGLHYLAILQKKVATIPFSVPEGQVEENDAMASFGVDPKAYDPDEEAWETLDPILNRFLGYGTTAEIVAGKVRRGLCGLDGLVAHLAHFIQDRGITGSLLEGKMKVLMDALDILSSSSQMEVPQQHLEFQTMDSMSIQSANSAQIPIDVDTWQESLPAGEQIESPRPCLGYRLHFPPGKTPSSSYPFGLHDTLVLPWDYAVKNGKMTVTARACTQVRILSTELCSACTQLDDSPILQGIMRRIESGVDENAPYAYHGHSGLVEVARRKMAQIDTLRLRGLNTARKLVGKQGTLDDYKRFVMGLADGGYERVDRIVRAAMSPRLGIHSLQASSYDRAAAGLYHPRNYTEKDDMRQLLNWRIGGTQMAEIAHRTGAALPGLSTIRRRSTVPTIIPSHSIPKLEEVTANVVSCFTSMDEVKTRVIHQVLMFDEIATERRPRWDSKTNKFLGVCREHGHKTALEFRNEKDLETLFDDLEKEQAHLASEATVGAIGMLGLDTRIYAARPVLVSGTCKKETAEEHVKVLETTLNAVNAQRPLTKLRTISIASDGEAKRGKALVQLTFKRVLSPDSNIYELLSSLIFMDLHVGDDDLTCDKDYKHIPKRLRNLALRDKGILVHGFHITPSVMKDHFREAGLTEGRIRSVFNPSDKQDVKLAYDMLNDIWNLPEPTPGKRPGFIEARTSLQIFGEFVFHLFYPYVCVDLSLSEQLEHLSAAAHLSLALFIENNAGKAFLPSQLYLDIMIMIKNVYFCVAKAVIDDPEGSFWIILLGTDRLESLFGILRTMVGNDANLDILQLVLRLTGCTEIANILAKYPQWQKTPRRLKLPLLDRKSRQIPNEADHINPRAWRGDVTNRHVSLISSWKGGRSLVEKKYPFVADLLTTAEANPKTTILSPFGKLLVPEVSIVLPSGTMEVTNPLDKDDTEEAEEDVQPASSPDSGTGFCAVEDAAAEEAAAFLPPTVIERAVTLGGKLVNKARALSARFKYRTSPSSTDRLKRVQEESRYDSIPEADIVDFDTGDGRPTLGLSEPICTLVRCEGEIFVCIGLVNSIKVDTQEVPQLDLNLLGEKTVKVTYQACRLIGTTQSDDPGLRNDWRTSRLCPDLLFTVPGSLIEPINPTISTRDPLKPFYLFTSSTLMAFGASFLDRFTSNDFRTLPTMTKATIDFPYMLPGSDEACFVVKPAHELSAMENSKDTCPSCPFKLDPTQGQRVLEHIGSHVLYDQTLDRSSEPCGLCLSPDPLCRIYLTKSKGRNGATKVDMAKSECHNLIKFNYSVAAKSEGSSFCSNVPMQCSLCPHSAPAVWRYNGWEHMEKKHPKVPVSDYDKRWTLTAYEKVEMLKAWKNRTKKSTTRTTTKRKLKISEAHSSSMANQIDGTRAINDYEERDEDSDSPDGDDIHRDDPEARADQYQVHAENSEEMPQPPADETTIDEASYDDDMDPSNIDDLYEDDTYTPDSGNADKTSHNEQEIQQETDSIHAEQVSFEAGPTATQASTDVIETGRPRRKRTAVEVNLSNCLCGHEVSQAQQRTTAAVKCRKNNCETVWYHYCCVSDGEVIWNIYNVDLHLQQPEDSLNREDADDDYADKYVPKGKLKHQISLKQAEAKLTQTDAFAFASVICVKIPCPEEKPDTVSTMTCEHGGEETGRRAYAGSLDYIEDESNIGALWRPSLSPSPAPGVNGMTSGPETQPTGIRNGRSI